QIKSHHYQPPDTVELPLASPLEDAASYSLSITGVEDIFGNMLTQKDTTFTFYQPTSADSGQVFINEFNYKPKEGETEYVELYNPTSRSFDLQGWMLSDNRSEPNTITSGSFMLPPKGYVILAPDNTLKESYPDIHLIAMGSRFPALNNSGDAVTIHNKNDILLDSLAFNTDWGDGETTLERRTTVVSAIYKENWGTPASEDASPGKTNSIAADKTPPEFIGASIIDKTKLKLRFSEEITSQSATNFSNYNIAPNRNIQLISARADSVTLFLADPLISEQEYTITISNMRDIFGNQSSPESKKITYVHLEKEKRQDSNIHDNL